MKLATKADVDSCAPVPRKFDVHVYHNGKPWILGPFPSWAAAKRAILERDYGPGPNPNRWTKDAWGDAFGHQYEAFFGGPGHAFELRKRVA